MSMKHMVICISANQKCQLLHCHLIIFKVKQNRLLGRYSYGIVVYTHVDFVQSLRSAVIYGKPLLKFSELIFCFSGL